MTKTIWELLVCRAHARRIDLELGYNPLRSSTARTGPFLPWSQTIREKMWTWAKYHAKP